MPARNPTDTQCLYSLAIISTCLAKLRQLVLTLGTVVWEGILRARHAISATAAVAASLLVTAACSSSSSSSSSGTTSNSSTSSVNWANESSAAAGGGMTALVAAAEKEGQLNVITLPSNWANYGAIMKAFSNKYHIKISDAIPSGSSSDEIAAMKSDKGRSNAPDVVDIGQSFAALPANQSLFAPYKVANWMAI